MPSSFTKESIKFIILVAFASIIVLNPSDFNSKSENIKNINVAYSQSKGFVKEGGYTYYYSQKTGKKLTGLQTIEGYRYYFSSTGKMQTGLQTIGGYKYYFSKLTGKALSGLRVISGNKYYFSTVTYKAKSGLRLISGNKYYFSTVTYKALSGLRLISGEKYYFSESTKEALSGLMEVDGYKYYFSKKTKSALSGLRVISGNKYYFSTATYKSLTGLRLISGNKYYFSESTGNALSGLVEVDGSKYYFCPETKIALSGFVTIDNNKYYFDESSKQMVFGLQVIDGKYYNFDEKTGILLEDEKVSGIIYKDGEPYLYVDEYGNSKTGMITVEEGVRYYFLKGGGIHKGFRTVGSKLYYFSTEDGKAQNGITKVGSDTYYFHPKYFYALTGLHSIWEKTYYLNPNDYKMMKNDTVKIGYLLFTADENGLVIDIKPATGYENNERAKGLIEGFKLIGTPYGSDDGQTMCNRFAATVYLAAGNDELIKYSQITGNMLYKKASEQAEYVLKKGYNENMTAYNLKPGDLIYWDNGPTGPAEDKFTFNGTEYSIGHVSVYVGEGVMIEATSVPWVGEGHTRVTTFDPSSAKPTSNPIIFANMLP